MEKKQELKTGDSVTLIKREFIEGIQYPAGQQLIVYEDVSANDGDLLIVIPRDTRTCLIGKEMVEIQELGRNERLLNEWREQLNITRVA